MSVLFLSTLLSAETLDLYASKKTENGLMGKNSFGVELNPFRLLLLGSEWQSYTGTISHFDNETGIEIAVPIFYSKDKNNNYNEAYKDTETLLTIDLDYRKYFSQARTEGGFLGLFGRYAYLDARVSSQGRYATVQKVGIGGEVGYRVKNIFNTPFYWGTSFKIGAYIGGDNDIFENSTFSLALDDNKLILDIELLKVGYEF